jgi:hypothetical protein
MIVEALEALLNFFGISGGQVGVALPLLAIALYWRKALYGAGKAKGMVSKGVFASVIIGLLVLTGVLDVNVAAAVSLSKTLFSFAADAFGVMA